MRLRRSLSTGLICGSVLAAPGVAFADNPGEPLCVLSEAHLGGPGHDGKHVVPVNVPALAWKPVSVLGPAQVADARILRADNSIVEVETRTETYPSPLYEASDARIVALVPTKPLEVGAAYRFVVPQPPCAGGNTVVEFEVGPAVTLPTSVALEATAQNFLAHNPGEDEHVYATRTVSVTRSPELDVAGPFMAFVVSVDDQPAYTSFGGAGVDVEGLCSGSSDDIEEPGPGRVRVTPHLLGQQGAMPAATLDAPVTCEGAPELRSDCSFASPGARSARIGEWPALGALALALAGLARRARRR